MSDYSSGQPHNERWTIQCGYHMVPAYCTQVSKSRNMERRLQIGSYTVCVRLRKSGLLYNTPNVSENTVLVMIVYFFRTKTEMIQMWSNIMVRDFTMNIHHQIIFRQSDMRGYEGAAEPTVTKNLTKINTYKILTWKPDWMSSLRGLGLIWIQIDHQPDATIFQFIILTFIYSSTCFRRFPAHHQELNDCSSNLWFYFRVAVIVVLCSWSGRPRTQHDYHNDTKVKPEAATAVFELLMVGG